MSDTEENIPENNKEEFKELTAGDAVERSFEERRNLMEKMKQNILNKTMVNIMNINI